MRRYWLGDLDRQKSQITFDGEIFHHICVVCRQDVGSKFEVLTSTGWAALVEVIEVGKKSGVAKVIEWREVPALPKPHIHLALSVPKIATLEGVLEKSVEMGVHSIHPFFSDFSFVKTQSSLLKDKRKRFEKILISATQQTGRADRLNLTEAVHLDELLKTFKTQEKTAGVFAYEGEGGSLKAALQEVQGKIDHIWIFVGSEGGFSHKEVELFKSINLFPVSLGQQVLRVETACVTLLGIIKYELGVI
ncbi:MAG: 16S rRNA (uracil(1498)-N(3))-methyltransferase [Bdellovibrionales bacterium]|nr:16S rRNA (uracil(1498)-N(3))-methyltransferase [Bdellovibrionales bacterium]